MSRNTLETSSTHQYGKSVDISSGSRQYGSSFDVPRSTHKYGNTVEIPVTTTTSRSYDQGSRSYEDGNHTYGQRNHSYEHSNHSYGNSLDASHSYGKPTTHSYGKSERSRYYDETAVGSKNYEPTRNQTKYGNSRSTEYVSGGYKLPRPGLDSTATPYEPPVDYDSDPPRNTYYRDTSGSGYISNDDRTVSEYTMEIERVPMADYGRSTDFRSPSEFSYRSARTDRSARTERSAKTDRSGKSYKSGRSLATSIPASDTETVKTKTSRFGKIEVETMSAPHPYCPNSKGICCLMILLNLALLLITLGFIIVFNLHKPAFVWYLGICMLIFGFLTLFGTLIYCVFVCRERPPQSQGNGDLYWTHHWRKSFTTPEIHYTNSQHRYFPTNDKNYAPSIHSNGSQHPPYYTHGEKMSIHSNGSQHQPYYTHGEKMSVHSNGSQHQPYYTHGEKMSIHSAQSNGTRR